MKIHDWTLFVFLRHSYELINSLPTAFEWQFKNHRKKYQDRGEETNDNSRCFYTQRVCFEPQAQPNNQTAGSWNETQP